MNCHKTYSLDFVKKANNIPKCLCGGIVRPDVILYGEMLHPGVYEKCYEVLQKTNLLLVAGTGLTVSTAANIINMFKGKHLVIINNQSTPYDYLAELVIHQDLTEVFLQLT
jgi:NAD-dependent deacetylase